MSSPSSIRDTSSEPLRLRGWVLQERLASGRQGTLFRAHNVHAPGMQVAVKMVDLLDSPGVHARCIREVELLSRLDHPSIVGVRDLHIDGDRAWIILDFVEGVALSDLQAMDRGGALGACVQLADALAVAHREGVWHRDVKPDNVLIREDGQAVLVDFGIAIGHDSPRISAAGLLSPATLYYAPPEWVQGDGLDLAAWDCWALGVVLYELLSKKRAFVPVWRGSRVLSVEKLVAEKVTHAPLDLGEGQPRQLRELVKNMTQPRPGDRMNDLGEVTDRLIELLQEDAVEVPAEERSWLGDPRVIAPARLARLLTKRGLLPKG